MSNITKEELVKEIAALRKLIESHDTYLTKCVRSCKKIETSLSKKDFNHNKLIEIKYQIIRLNKRINNTANDKKTAHLYYAGFTVLLYGFLSIFSKSLLQWNLDFVSHDIITYTRFILISILGFLARQYSKGVGGDEDILSRLIMSIIFPTVFVSLFLYNEDKILEISTFSVMFAGGFSTEIVIGFLNNLVDNAKKILNIDNSMIKENNSNSTL
ncbi:hypothetical protein [Paenibacillus sp. ATY16]|uniref:hypothetical protein n=1 Tax=Paenibacillus sp. ATY16 TaxID=1759312 RepID=UPI000E2FDF7F|nr:hypothetical protein [Paenibacillus sp. ATY16]MCK9861714.1 hypothetical protein [Paenibacillus sp. ATY16]